MRWDEVRVETVEFVVNLSAYGGIRKQMVFVMGDLFGRLNNKKKK